MKILVLQFFPLIVSRIAVNITVMAKVISDELMKLKIIVNGDEGQKQILEFERANKTLSLRIKDLTDKQKELSKQRKQDSAEYKANKLEIEKLSTAIADNKKKIDDQIKSMDNSRLTMEQLRKKAADLKLTMNHMNPNSKDLATVQKDLKGVETRILELRNGARASGSSISNLADKFNHYSGIATALTATLAGVVLSVQGVIDYNNKLVDAQTKVGKATGMTNEEVKELTKSFSEFKTRTSNMDLLKIAEVGGKLGVPTSEIKAFTQEVDKAFVALGDNFTGGVEAVANKLGKLKGIFKETKDQNVAEAINDIGSALNELDNQGTASAENVSDFALRVGTLPEKLKPTIAETLGLGAAFEESGINAERASSGYNKFVRVAATETKKFAEVMRISEQEVKNLINQDPLQFFLKFAEGAKGLDATEISKMLEFLNLNDAEVISVIGAASESTDRFRNSIETSNQALAEGTSLQEEFNRVNTNTAAIFEKVKKSIIGAFSSETVAKGLNFLISSIANLLGVGNEAEEKASVLRRTLSDLFAIVVIGVTAFISVNTAIAVYNNLIKESIVKDIALETIGKARNARLLVQNSLMSIWNFLVAGGAFAVNKLTTALGLETIAAKSAEIQQKSFNAAMSANPIGAVVAVLTLLIGTLYILKRRYDEAREAAKKNYEETYRYKTLEQETFKKGKDAVDEYKNSVNGLISILKDENTTQGIRKKAYESLIKIHPEFMGTVDKEFIATKKLSEVYSELAKQIEISARTKARVAAKQSLYDENAKLELEYIKTQPKRDAEQKARNDFRKKYGKRDDVITKFLDNATGFSVGFEENNKGVEIINKINENNALLKKINLADANRIKQLQNLLKTAKGSKKKELETELFNLIGISSDDANVNKPNYKIPGTVSSTSSKGNKSTEKAEDKMLKEGEKAIDIAKQIELQKQEALAELQDDWYQKELGEILAQEQRKMDEIDKLYKSPEELKKLDEMIAKSSGTTKEQLQKTKDQWIANNAELDNLKLITRETTFKKLRTLDEKQSTAELKKAEEDLQKKLALLQREENETIAKLTTIEEQKAFLQGKISDDELSKIKTWNDGKQAIQKYYQQESLNLQTAYLQELVKQLEQIPADAITPEQLKLLDELKNKLAEIAKTKAEINNPTDNNKLGSELSQFGTKSNGADFFGLDVSQWQGLFKNIDTTLSKQEQLEQKLQKVGAAIQIAQNLYSQFYAFQQRSMDAELRKYEVNSDRKKKKLKAELDAGYINQETYKNLTLEVEADLERKKQEMVLKKAKQDRIAALFGIATNTALGIMQSVALSPLTGGMPWTAIVGALGALQAAFVLSQPLPEAPGAEDGYYPTIREQDGKMFNAKRRTLKSGLYSEPTVLVGEGNKTELVVDSRTLKRINPTIQQEYMREIQRVKGYETGMIPNSNNSSDEILIKAMQVMENVNQSLETLSKFGVIARWENLYKTVEQIDDTREERQRIIEKNKR